MYASFVDQPPLQVAEKAASMPVTSRRQRRRGGGIAGWLAEQFIKSNTGMIKS